MKEEKGKKEKIKVKKQYEEYKSEKVKRKVNKQKKKGRRII